MQPAAAAELEAAGAHSAEDVDAEAARALVADAAEAQRVAMSKSSEAEVWAAADVGAVKERDADRSASQLAQTELNQARSRVADIANSAVVDAFQMQHAQKLQQVATEAAQAKLIQLQAATEAEQQIASKAHILQEEAAAMRTISSQKLIAAQNSEHAQPVPQWTCEADVSEVQRTTASRVGYGSEQYAPQVCVDGDESEEVEAAEAEAEGQVELSSPRRVAMLKQLVVDPDAAMGQGPDPVPEPEQELGVLTVSGAAGEPVPQWPDMLGVQSDSSDGSNHICAHSAIFSFESISLLLM